MFLVRKFWELLGYGTEAEPESEEEIPPAPDFEEAIEACGFGFFNIFLLLASLFGLWAAVFETNTMSFVIPAARCDLGLTLMDRGGLNAITFGGMIVSALPWGFVADNFSRKYILVGSLISESILTALSILSQTTEHFMIFKFFSGFISCGANAVFPSFISEFHGKRHRVYVLMAVGFINALALIALPVLATILLPTRFYMILGYLKSYSWKIFIAATAIPSLICGIMMLIFPETPRFLMSQGRNGEAMTAFQYIYSINKCKKKNEYPITEIYQEEKARRRAAMSRKSYRYARKRELSGKLREGIEDLWELCTKRNIGLTLVACLMQFCLVLCVTTIGLWTPQNSAMTREMQYHGWYHMKTCDVIKYMLNNTDIIYNDIKKEHCDLYLSKKAFIDSMVIGGTICLNFLLAALLVRFVKNNVLLRTYLIIATITIILRFYASSRILTLTLSSVNTACAVASVLLLGNTFVNLFPTRIRTITFVVLLASGRFGGVVGNLLLPFLMAAHCSAMYAFFAFCYFLSFILSFVLPHTAKLALK